MQPGGVTTVVLDATDTAEDFYATEPQGDQEAAIHAVSSFLLNEAIQGLSSSLECLCMGGLDLNGEEP